MSKTSFYGTTKASLPALLLFIALLLMWTISVFDNTLVGAATGAVVISEINISNVRDVSFTVSWITDQNSNGTVQYGTDPANLNQSANDDRGAATNDDTHYVTISGLSPETTYYFDVVSDGTTDNNSGGHYSITTGPTLGVPSSDTIFGQVFQSNGTTVAEDTIVKIILRDNNATGSSGNAASLSALIDANGFWNVNLGNARLSDLSAYFQYSQSGDEIVIEAQGAGDGTATHTIDTAVDAPAANMTLTLPTTTPTATVASSTPTPTVASSTPTPTVASNTPTATVANSTATATLASSTATATVASSTATATIASNTPTATIASNTPTATLASNTPTATIASNTPTATGPVASSTPTATGTIAINTPTATMTMSPIITNTLTPSQSKLYLPVILRKTSN